MRSGVSAHGEPAAQGRLVSGWFFRVFKERVQ